VVRSAGEYRGGIRSGGRGAKDALGGRGGPTCGWDHPARPKRVPCRGIEGVRNAGEYRGGIRSGGRGAKAELGGLGGPTCGWDHPARPARVSCRGGI